LESWAKGVSDKAQFAEPYLFEAIPRQSALGQFEDIKKRLRAGALTVHEARAEALPIVEAVNAKAREVAKRHGVRPRLVGVAGVLR